MNRRLRLLLVQEFSQDATLLLNQLQSENGYHLVTMQVATAEAFKQAFSQSNWDIVIADYDSKRLSYESALQLLKEIEIDVPLIVVASEIDVQSVVHALKVGAKNLVTKANLATLKEILEMELMEAQLRHKGQKNHNYKQGLLENSGEIREGTKAEVILAAHNQILELIVKETPLTEVLEAIVRVVEDFSEDIKCSFTFLDDNGVNLRSGIAPSLPEEYNQAIDGIAIGPGVGCCGTAAYRQESVIVEDIAVDPLWTDYRDLALNFGLKAWWSVPIMTKKNKFLSIFTIFYSTPRSPSEKEKQLIIKATNLAAIAIERHRTQSQLQKTQSQLQHLSNNIPGVIYQYLQRTDGSYCFPFVSASCTEVYEVTPEEIHKNPDILFQIVDELERPNLHKKAAISAETMQPWKWEGKITTRSGSVKWIKSASRPEKQPNGDIIWHGVVMDITESKKTQQALETAMYELQNTQMQLVQTEKMSSLGQLVAGIAHEINNPLNFIYNNLHFLCEYIQEVLNLIDLYQLSYPHPVEEIEAKIAAVDFQFVREDLPKMLSSMQIGTDRICDLVLSLRNFSRVDQITAQTVDIHKVIDSVVLILQHRLKPHGENPGIEIVKNYGNLPDVKCYPGQLNQVFMNLISNAIDAIEESFVIGHLSLINDKGQITISTQFLENDSDVVIKIADNGSGIPADCQNQIFQTFFTTKPVGKGTGLGLSISYQIVVENHSGQLKCLSEPGQGTEFWIQIPIL